MSESAIRVEGLGKEYRIGRQHGPYRTLRETVTETLGAPWRRARHLLRGQASGASELDEHFWALQDLSFTVPHGQVVGIIGRNGAGKSTLLKILSRITEPTTGRITLHGRVGSLLEVGTGFHPELTGRENIYLNGAILGMRRAEIARKFDEMVAFAEIERFIDTPVKHYSSGMYVRLAFAVAAHLEPEILLVDEVLAVGDAAFQQKCLGKMENVARQGRTVLFVSHQLGMVNQLCDRAILLQDGRLHREGATQSVVDYYTTQLAAASAETIATARVVASKETQLLRLYTERGDGSMTTTFAHNEPIVLKLDYLVRKALPDVLLSVAVYDRMKRKVFTSQIALQLTEGVRPTTEQAYTASMTIPAETLTPGSYSFLAALHIPFVQALDQIDDTRPIQIIDAGSEFAQYEGLDYGTVFVRCAWTTTPIPLPSSLTIP